jgi:hypothetical protein
MTQSSLYIIIFAIILIAAGYFLISRLLKRGKKTKIKTESRPYIQRIADILKAAVGQTKADEKAVETMSLEGPINALVVNVKKKMFRPMHVDLKPDKDYGREWEYLTYKNLYWLRRNPDRTVEVILPPEVLADSPTELYEAVQTADDMDEVFGWQDTGGNKSRLFLMVIAGLVTIFIMFMAMTYKKPGGA